MRAVALILVLWLCGAPPAAAAPADPPHTVAPLTVYPPTPAPKIVSSYPAAGQAVPAGLLVIRVTFDQPMLNLAFDLGPAPEGDLPNCLKTPRLLEDNRTFVLLCTVKPEQAYAVSFNAGAAAGFANVAARRAQPAALAFTTTGELGAADLASAIKAAGLTARDVPIQEDPNRPGRRPSLE